MADKLSTIQEELLKRADSIFSSVATAVGQAKDIAVEQLPDIAYQYVAYNRVYLTLLCLGSVSLWLLLQYIVINRMNHWAKGKDWDADQIGVYLMTTFISAILFGGMFLATLKDKLHLI